MSSFGKMVRRREKAFNTLLTMVGHLSAKEVLATVTALMSVEDLEHLIKIEKSYTTKKK